MARDPYRYFRIEAQELLEHLGRGVLELERSGDPEVIKQLLRHAHTLKGASRIVKRGEIGNFAHELEDLLAPHRDSTGVAPRATVDDALRIVDEIRRLVAALDEPSGPAPTEAVREPAKDPETSVRVPVRELDALLHSVGEARGYAFSAGRAAVGLGRLQAAVGAVVSSARLGARAEQLVEDLERSHRDLLDHIERLQTELQEVRQAASDLRLVPAQPLLADLERAVRDAARSLEKDVEFRTSGGETHIDAHVLEGLRGALGHLVRNSVAHGIESAAERIRAGKQARGVVEISIARRGHRVCVRCRDDGRGLDLEAVRAAAIDRGLVPPNVAQAMDQAALAELLLRGGVSTSRTLTTISGRGVGLDAVRHAVEALKGEVQVSSVARGGVTIELLVPLSLSMVPALALHVDEEAVLVPLDSVERTLRVPRAEISRDSSGERMVVDGQVVPFVLLRNVLERPQRVRAEVQSAVILASEGRMAAIGVDRVGGVRNIVVCGIPAHAAADSVVSGATMQDDGTPALVLSPSSLTRASLLSRPTHDEVRAREVPPLLVIDDSLTTRMLEQSILESAGYVVDLAVSAEEGLTKARQRKYAVFIVDVEMPGMSGFEFIESARRDPDLRDVPAILVTSRAEPEDKRRGAAVGACAYIVKGEFDQGELLSAIRGATQ